MSDCCVQDGHVEAMCWEVGKGVEGPGPQNWVRSGRRNELRMIAPADGVRAIKKLRTRKGADKKEVKKGSKGQGGCGHISVMYQHT